MINVYDSPLLFTVELFQDRDTRTHFAVWAKIMTRSLIYPLSIFTPALEFLRHLMRADPEQN